MTDATPTLDLKATTRTARDPATTAEQLQACAGQGDAIDRLLAKHPNASAQLLEQLSHSSDRATRKAVTLHPNTPKDALIKLAPQFPGDFFQNPAFDWLLIEHPNLMFDIGGGVLKNVLKRAECPQSFMVWAATHGSEQERLAVAMNPQAQADVLQAIERRGGKAAQAAQQHANHPLASGEGDLESAFRKAVERAIAEGLTAEDVPTLAQWPALSVTIRLGGNWFDHWFLRHRLAPQALVTSVMTALAGDAYSYARSLAAYNRATPPDVLSILAGDPNSRVRSYIACNPATPPDALSVLAGDADEYVRLCVAENPATPSDMRIEVLTTLDANFRQTLAESATAADVLSKLASDTETLVRRAVARNRITPADALSKLASDCETEVRSGVAGNPASPVGALTALASDSDSEVRSRVALSSTVSSDVRLHLLATLAGDPDKWARSNVARNPATPVDVLTTLAGDSENWVRSEVAGNPATPVGILTALASDFHNQVRSGVAANPATPVDILTMLASDSDSLVRCAVYGNVATPAAVQTSLAGDAHSEVQRCVAANPATPVGILTTLAGHHNSSVRKSVAANLATPVYILATLASDPDINVRVCAVDNPASPADQLAAAECEALQKAMLLDPRRSPWWTDQLAKLKPKDADLKRACETGDVLYLPDKVAEKACRKKILAWRLLGLSHQFAAPEELAKRSRSTEWVERMAVARSPNSPPNVIEILRKDPHRMVARQADATATLKAVTTTRLERLFREMSGESAEEALVHEARKRLKRRCVSDLSFYSSRWSRCLLPGQWLGILDANAQVKLETLLPEDLKQAMARFWSNPAIAVGNLEGVHLPSVVMRLAKHSRKPGVQLWVATRQRAVAANPATPAATLTALAGDPDSDARVAVAANPVTPAAVLTTLAGDYDSSVRRRVAANPATPAATLTTLVGDESWHVSIAAASNPATPAETLSSDRQADVQLAAARAELRRALATETPSPEQSAVIQSWIDELQGGLAEPVVLKDVSDSEFRLAFDALGLMPAEGDKRAIAKAAKSKDWLERAAATYAPGIQPSLLKSLLDDPVEAVRQSAVAQLRAAATG